MRLRALTLVTLLVGAAASARTAVSAPRQSTKRPPAKDGQTAQRLMSAPQYLPGQVIRYQLEITTTTEAHHGGAVHDPQEPGKLTIVWTAITRMEVLSAGKDAQGKPNGSMRIRATYEKSAATASSTSYDPEAVSTEDQYNRLEGTSFEFTVDAAGHVTDITGLGGSPGQGQPQTKQNADAMQAWVKQFSSTTNVPPGGMTVGQTWSVDQPVPSAPLADLVWRAHSTYMRNEPCQPANAAGAANPMAGETCAVILTNLSLLGAKPGRDVTPQSYREKGLRTAGIWSGEGDSLSYISLSTGRIVSVTQSSSEQMDFSISGANGDHRMSYQGAVQSHSSLALLSSGKQ